MTGRKLGLVRRLANLRQRERRFRFDVLFYTPTVSSLLRPDSGLPPGGAETQVLLLTTELARSGLKVALVANSVPGGLPSEIDGVVILPRPAYRPHSPLTGKIKEALKIWRTLHDANAHTIVKRSYGIDVGLVALYARATRRRFIYSSANVVDFAAEKLLLKQRDLILFHIGLRLASEIVVQTEEQIPLCESRFSRRPILIKSIAVKTGERVRKPNAFLWIGRIVDYKQPWAFVRLARDRPEAQFVMVGVPDPTRHEGLVLYAEIGQAVRDLPNLELLEPRSRAHLAPLIDGAVAMVNTADYEGMPNVLLEGWTRGVPALVLTHDPGGVVERHGLGGFAHGSPDRLSELAAQMWLTRETTQADVAARCLDYISQEHAPGSVAFHWRHLVCANHRQRLE